MLKELLYAGVGGMVFLKERVEDELKKLEEKGKISTTDAKSFMDSLKEKGEAEEHRFKEEIKKALREVIDELGLATKQDIEELKH